jgi:hypothetical protein
MPSKKQRSKQMKKQKPMTDAEDEKVQLQALRNLQKNHPEFSTEECASMEYMLHLTNKFQRTFSPYKIFMKPIVGELKQTIQTHHGLQTPVVINVVDESLDELKYSWLVEISLTSPKVGGMIPLNEGATQMGMPQFK